MDLTERYIKMSVGAKELQKEKFLVIGDYMWLGGKYLQISEACRVVTSLLHVCESGEIWLPQQDQLQKLVWRKNVQHTLLNFYNEVGFMNTKEYKYWLQFTTMEQLWLAFVMFENYNKIWDDKKSKWKSKGIRK